MLLCFVLALDPSVSVFGETWPEEGPPTLQAFTESVEWLKAKLTKLKKQHTGSDKEVEFLTENYTSPSLVSTEADYCSLVQ